MVVPGMITIVPLPEEEEYDDCIQPSNNYLDCSPVHLFLSSWTERASPGFQGEKGGGFGWLGGEDGLREREGRRGQRRMGRGRGEWAAEGEVQLRMRRKNLGGGIISI